MRVPLYLVMSATNALPTEIPANQVNPLPPTPPKSEGEIYLEEGIDLRTPMPMREIERRAIIAALIRTGGNMTQAMRELGLGRTTLYRKLKKYGLR